MIVVTNLFYIDQYLILIFRNDYNPKLKVRFS